MKFYRNKKKWKLCDIGIDDRYNCYLESMILRFIIQGWFWKLYSECKELMLGILLYWNFNRIFFQFLQVFFMFCWINRKFGLKDLKQMIQFICYIELSRGYRKYVI